MDGREQKDVPPDFSELDNLHKFVSSFLGRVEKVERGVNLDNDIGAMPHEDTKSKMAELRNMVTDVENRIQDAGDDLAQSENLHKHVHIFHNYYMWVNREINRITERLEEHGYQHLDEHTNLPSNMHQIWDVGLNVQNKEDQCNHSPTLRNVTRVSQLGALQQDLGQNSIDDGAINSVDVSFDAVSNRETGDPKNAPETPKSLAQTSVTAKFVTVHKLSPQLDYEQTITNLKAYFQEKPNESFIGNNTSFLSTNSEFMNTSLNKPDFGASSFDQLNSSWLGIGQEPISGKDHLAPTLSSLATARNNLPKTNTTSSSSPHEGGSSLGDPIGLCTEQEWEMLKDQISLTFKEVNDMIMNLNQVYSNAPDEPLDLSAGDIQQRILTMLNRIKFEIRGKNIGYFPINTAS